MIYLGHKEHREFGVSRISDPAYLDAQARLNMLYRKMLDGVSHTARASCAYAIKTAFKDGVISTAKVPWNNLFHCGD